MTLKTLKKRLTGLILAGSIPLTAVIGGLPPPASAETPALSAAPLPAQAQNCRLHDTLAATLSNRFKESRTAYGIIGQKAVMEIYASAAGTWTVVVTTTNGIACIIAAGHSFERLPEPLAGNPARYDGGETPFRK